MKDMKVAYLLDFYGSLISDKQREILEMYYQEDISLAEIASVTDMTRQGEVILAYFKPDNEEKAAF